jgi:hypothetical protein
MTYLHAVASLDGYLADEDDVGPLHDWYFNGTTRSSTKSTPISTARHFWFSAASADYVCGMWSRWGTPSALSGVAVTDITAVGAGYGPSQPLEGRSPTTAAHGSAPASSYRRAGR